MHETDGMLFIEPVLAGFFDRNFKLNKKEDINFIKLCLDDIRSFIQDKEPYWVKEKTFLIISLIEELESAIKAGRFEIISEGEIVAFILERTKKKINNYVQHNCIEGNNYKVVFFVEQPTLL